MKFFLCLLAVLMTASGLFGQTAALHGVVTDQSEAAIAGATVTVIGPGGVQLEAKTNEEGRYVFYDLAPGTYMLRVSQRGFADFEKSGVEIVGGKPRVVDARLVVTLEKQNVTVNADNPGVSINSENNAGAVVLRGEDLSALSDDPTDLEADLQALAGPSAGPSGGAIYIDGFTAGGVLPSKESIREIRINQNPFSPEYDKLGYGRIEIFTKPGTDRYHGNLGYNLGTDIWNSRNPYSTHKAPFLLNELEGDVGGPMGKRTSFIVEYQRNTVDNGAITNAVTLDPQTSAITPFNAVLSIPQRFTRLKPRVDRQLNEHHTLMFSYDFTRSDIHDAGIGGFNLLSRGYHSQYTDQTVQFTETAVLGTTVNETRFQYYRTANEMITNSFSPALQVLGSFNGGGSPNGRSFNTQNNVELQNYTSMLRSKHAWKFGIRLREQMNDSVAPQNFDGTFVFGGGLAPVLDAMNQPVLDPSGQRELAPITSIERYRRTLVFQQIGFSPAQIRALGGGATQFSINAGTSGLSVNQVDVGGFVGDDWRVCPNLTLSLGTRYETQTNIHDWRDFSPRVAIAWVPGRSTSSSHATTVLRVGFGIFYDRFGLANTLTADRYNGVVQQQYVVPNPDFFPTIPSPAALAGFLSTQVIEKVSPTLRAPYIMQSAVTLERQLPANTTLAVTYSNSHGVHLLRSQDINAPWPGTYNPNVQGSGTFPLGHPGPIFLMESSGIYNQNQLIANLKTKVNADISLFGFYVLNRAMSNTDGVGTFPANPYNMAGEYGPASTDVRHRVTFGGSINLRWNMRISPFVVLQSGAPFDITTGNDLFGTTLFNSRPGIATDTSKPGLIQTRYGLFDPNPSPGEHLVSRNFGRGPAQIRMNLRLSKTIGFGSERGGEQRANTGGGGPTPALATGRGLGSVIGVPTTVHRYNLTISMAVQNLLNHTNPGPIIGDVTSPLFGTANQSAGGPNGEGLFETANNRRLELQMRITF